MVPILTKLLLFRSVQIRLFQTAYKCKNKGGLLSNSNNLANL